MATIAIDPLTLAPADRTPAQVWAIVEANRALAVFLARKLVRRGVEIEDLVQEATLGLRRAAIHFDPARSEKFSGYASLIIRGWIHSVQRRRRMHPVPGEPLISHDVQYDPEPEPEGIEADERSRLQEALGVLNDRERRVIHERFFAGRWHKDLAAEWGCTPTNVCNIQRRALRKLKRALGCPTAE